MLATTPSRRRTALPVVNSYDQAVDFLHQHFQYGGSYLPVIAEEEGNTNNKTMMTSRMKKSHTCQTLLGSNEAGRKLE